MVRLPDLEVGELGGGAVRAWPDVAAAGPDHPRRSGKVVFTVSALALLVVLLARNAYVFTSPVHEDGDLALNSLLVRRALHLQLLVGNYSRVGFHHPGPAFLYLLAAGQAVFFHLLHVVPAPYNGQLLGDLVFTSAIVGWIVLIVDRVTGSRLAAATTFVLVLLFAANHAMLANLWFPYLYVPVFALLLVSGAALASGRTRELPAFVLAGGLLVHGHISFSMFVAVTSLAVAVGWVTIRRHDWREQLRAHRRQTRLSAGLVGLFVLPLALQTVLDYPGPWPEYLQYLTRQEGGPHPFSAALGFFSWYWSSSQLPVPLTCLAAATGLALLRTDRMPTRRSYFLALYGLLFLESVLFAGYVIRGVDRLLPVNRYLGFFYLTVPLLVLVAAAAQLAAQGADVGRRVSVVLGTAVLVAFAIGATRPGVENSYRGFAGYSSAVTALESAPERRGRPVAVQFPHDSWPVVAGVVLEARRRQVPICVDEPDPVWTNLFTERHICQGQLERWEVHIARADQFAQTGQVVWQSSRMVISYPVPAAAAQRSQRALAPRSAVR